MHLKTVLYNLHIWLAVVSVSYFILWHVVKLDMTYLHWRFIIK